jgi:hypothetical protein
MYPGLAASADVLGFDLYPLQNWCRFDSFGDVFDSQLDLVALCTRASRRSSGSRRGRWIAPAPELDPTPETLRAEAWLSIAGGCPRDRLLPRTTGATTVGAAIAQVNHEISTLTPALGRAGDRRERVARTAPCGSAHATTTAPST